MTTTFAECGTPARSALRAGCLGLTLLLLCVPPAARAHDGGKPHHADPARPGVPTASYQRLVADEPAPSFVLLNQNGARLSLDDLRGKAVVLTFFYTSCTDVCPLLLHAMTLADSQLTDAERARVRFVAITVDPRRDQPQRLKAFLSERGLDGRRWQLLTESVEVVAKVVADYGVVVRPAPRGDFVHNSVYAIIDPAGQERVEFHGVATPPEALVREIRDALAPVRPGG